MSKPKIIWTEKGPVEQAVNWTVSQLVAAVSFGRCDFRTAKFLSPEIFESAFKKPGLNGSDLKSAFREALTGLSPLPIDDVIIFACMQDDTSVNYALVRREEFEAERGLFVSKVEGQSNSFETGNFRVWKSALLTGLVSLVAVSTISAMTSYQNQKVELQAQLDDIQAKNIRLVADLKRAKAAKQTQSSLESFRLAHKEQAEPSTHIFVLNDLAKRTPENAWWRAVSFDLSSGYRFDMRAGNAAETIAVLKADLNTHQLEAGGRISMERPGVEAFTLTRPSGSAK